MTKKTAEERKLVIPFTYMTLVDVNEFKMKIL